MRFVTNTKYFQYDKYDYKRYWRIGSAFRGPRISARYVKEPGFKDGDVYVSWPLNLFEIKFFWSKEYDEWKQL